MTKVGEENFACTAIIFFSVVAFMICVLLFSYKVIFTR